MIYKKKLHLFQFNIKEKKGADLWDMKKMTDRKYAKKSSEF